MDNEFEPLKPLLSETCIINTTAKGDHVGEIERFIQTIKGKCRCISSEMREIGITHLPIAKIKATIAFCCHVAKRFEIQVGGVTRVCA